MAYKTLTLENIPSVDNGRVSVAFNDALRRVMEDVRDRPNEKKIRRVTLHVEIAPRTHDEQGVLEGGDVQFKVEDLVPKRQTVIYPMKMNAQALLFEPESPDDYEQMPLSDGKIDKTTGEVIED